MAKRKVTPRRRETPRAKGCLLPCCGIYMPNGGGYVWQRRAKGWLAVCLQCESPLYFDESLELRSFDALAPRDEVEEVIAENPQAAADLAMLRRIAKWFGNPRSLARPEPDGTSHSVN